MKTLIVTIFLLINVSTNSQSVLTLGSGTSLGISAGTDLCANIISGTGILYGGGTICGGLVAINPIASNELPAKFDVSQNYPNPFNPVTNIKYQLPKADYISIKLFDQLGRETAVLFEGNLQAGYYQVTVDGQNLSSGIYFCRINTSDFSKVIKISLIK